MSATNRRGVVFIPDKAPALRGGADGPQAEDKALKNAADERSPLRLFAEDCYLLFKNLRSFPDVFLPIHRAAPLPGVPKTSLLLGHSMIALLSVVQLPLLAAALPAALVLPGWASASIAGVGSTCMWLLARMTWGPLIVESQVDVDRDKFKNETWIFVNGIATSHAQLQKTVDNLSATFGRAVTGVHNQSWGVPGDLIECLIQRSFFYQTQDVRVAAAAVEQALLDDGIGKVVLLAHSQGGLIVSLVLDRLYATLPAGVFKKLEIYTFGSAASYFHNPLVTNAHSGSISPVQRRTLAKASSDSPALASTLNDLAVADLVLPNRLVPIIEHYVNGRDLVPRWGVMYHVLLSTGSSYSGRVFVHEHQAGHLFDEHYLSLMFPLLQHDAIVSGDDPKLFLNHVVSLQQDTSVRGRRWWGIWRASTLGHGLDRTAVKAKPGATTITTPSTTSTTTTTATTTTTTTNPTDDRSKVLPGTTVKDLSKLWRYMGGGVA